IERLSGRIRRLRRIIRTMRPEVEGAIERALGSSFLFLSPTPKRIGSWRSRANDLAARMAGYAYAAYAHLKISTVVEETAGAIFRLGGGGDKARQERVRKAVWNVVRDGGLVDAETVTAHGLSADAIAFLRDFDAGFRARRLRFVTRRLTGMRGASDADRTARDD